MTTGRRLSAAVLSGVLAAGSLAGCRSAPNVAAYVGKSTITEQEVDDVVRNATEAADQVNKGLATDDPLRVKVPPRDQIVSTMLVNEICGRLKTDRNLTFLNVDEAAVARDEALPPDSTIARERANLYACISTLEQTAAPVAPTEAELRDIFDRGQKAGAIDPELKFEDVGDQLDGQQVRSALGLRKPFVDAIDRYDVTVNPKYQPLEVPILSFQGGIPAISVVLTPGEKDPAVVDRT